MRRTNKRKVLPYRRLSLNFLGFENMSPQTILTPLLHPIQLIFPDPGQNLRPKGPVQKPEAEYCPPCDSMGPVRKGGVWVRANRGLSKWYDEEENVDGAEESSRSLCGDSDSGPVWVWSVGKIDDPERNCGVDD